jgi:hypothetical protein
MAERDRGDGLTELAPGGERPTTPGGERPEISAGCDDEGGEDPRGSVRCE